ncbi:MAG: regulatory protein [Pseudonocardiales bacterium]|nr:regulatory protein [Pseudonocardiales bacterium]
MAGSDGAGLLAASEGDPRDGAPGDPETTARIICLQLLDRRARSRTELATALRRRGVPDEAARAVLDRFAEVGLVDDAALAETVAATQHRERGLAGRAVARKLRQRGIPDADVDRALAQVDADSERGAAERLVARRLPALRGADPAARTRRLVGLLARRGYAPALAYEVVRAALDADLDAPAHPDLDTRDACDLDTRDGADSDTRDGGSIDSP